MRPDIKIKSEQGSFKFRVCGVLQYQNKFLVQKIESNDFYSYPGGHVEIGENTDEAIDREMNEELPYKFKINRVLSIMQNFFSYENLVFHELDYWYLLDAGEELNTEDCEVIENDKGELKKLEYKWLTIDELQVADVRPDIMKKLLKNIDKVPMYYINNDTK